MFPAPCTILCTYYISTRLEFIFFIQRSCKGGHIFHVAVLATHIPAPTSTVVQGRVGLTFHVLTRHIPAPTSTVIQGRVGLTTHVLTRHIPAPTSTVVQGRVGLTFHVAPWSRVCGIVAH